MTFEEFKKTIYYTEKRIVIPLLGIKLEKVDYIKNGKILFDKIESTLKELYEKNLKKLKN
jgi:rhamnogalacturonyl hydrolase YesR